MREQRHLMISPLHDSAGCSGILPWTYYVNDPSGLVLAVYHGRQMKRSQLGAGCPDPPTPPTQPTRRVFMYPVEYRAYGPDGINVVYERENYGVNAGQWVKRLLQAHDASGNHEQHYELFGAEKGQVARRTGWLDREIDWETSPLSDLYRTVDLVNRKYDPQRATFLTSDPLWMMSADASSYHYGYHDPMNMIDPWGLDPLSNPVLPNKKNKNQSQPNINTGPSGESGSGQSGAFDVPGSHLGGTGGLGSGSGNGATGKTDVLPSSSKTGTGQSEVVGPSKLGHANILAGTLDNVADRGLEAADYQPTEQSAPAEASHSVPAVVGGTSLVMEYLLATTAVTFGVGALMLSPIVLLPGDTPLEARRYPGDDHHDEHNDGARRKPGNNGKMGKNGKQNKDWLRALRDATRAEGIRRVLDNKTQDKMHDDLQGITDDFPTLVRLMREWLQGNNKGPK